MSAAPALDVSGHCYCGAVQYRVRIPAGAKPTFTAYCHCDSCRRAHAAPLYHVAGILESWLTFTAGQEHIKHFRKSSEAKVERCFCERCGSKLMNVFPQWQVDGVQAVAFFPNTLNEETQHALPDMLRPQKVANPSECVLDWDTLLAAQS